MLHDDPNESSVVYLLTLDNKHTLCATDFSPTSLPKILAMIFLRVGDFPSCATQGKGSSFTNDVHFGTKKAKL